MTYNHEEYLKFAKISGEQDYAVMNELLIAAKDYFLGRSNASIELTLWEYSTEGVFYVSTGLATGSTPMMACVKMINILSEKYGLKVFDGNPDDDENVRSFCQESVEAVFENRRK